MAESFSNPSAWSESFRSEDLRRHHCSGGETGLMEEGPVFGRLWQIATRKSPEAANCGTNVPAWLWRICVADNAYALVRAEAY